MVGGGWLAALFKTMERLVEVGHVRDWGVERMNLENVFLSVVE
jgi:hypothetical protein